MFKFFLKYIYGSQRDSTAHGQPMFELWHPTCQRSDSGVIKNQEQGVTLEHRQVY